MTKMNGQGMGESSYFTHVQTMDRNSTETIKSRTFVTKKNKIIGGRCNNPHVAKDKRKNNGKYSKK